MPSGGELATRLSISEAARQLDRSPHTLRSWDRNGSMPKRLRPHRDANGHRYWTPSLIEEIKKWMAANHFHPGRGIAYNPTPERLQAHIDKIRHAAGARNNVDHRFDALREMITEALVELNVSEADIIKTLPDVAAQHGMDLEDALRVAWQVIGSVR